MLAGTLDWMPPPPKIVEPEVEKEPPKEFTPAPHPQSYHQPPKARTERKRAKPDSLDSDAMHSGDSREIVGTQIRRAPTMKSLHDPGLRRVASVLAKPRPKKQGDHSEDPTRRLQAMLRKS